MKQFSVRKYTSTDKQEWNDFVSKAKNATFLFHRDFMEYHQDRFDDYSLIIEDDKNWVAVLPANRVGNELFSHQGLTYGGLVYKDSLKLENVLSVFKSLLKMLQANDVNKLAIKLIPTIYCDFFSDELNYALFLTEAKLTRRDTLAVLDLSKEIKLSKNRKQGIRRGKKNELKIKEENDFASFWSTVLIPNLKNKHQATPVHSLAEITALKHKFPLNIRQFNVYKENELIGGTTVFESKNVAHLQYISATINKNEYGTLDFLYYYLITEVFKNKPFFDFGVSNEEQGKSINGGLSFWKESFGANIVTQDFYEVDTTNFTKLEQVIK